MAASATLARGHVRLAEGDPMNARREFEAAAHQWSQIGAPYETALARMGLGHALRTEGEEERALLEFGVAQTAFARIGAMSQAARAAAALRADGRGRTGVTPIATLSTAEHAEHADPHPPEDNAFRVVGDYWSMVFDGRAASVRDSRGLRYLSRLLAEPGREFHVLDLVALERAPANGEPALAVRVDGDAGELLDRRAKEAYRRRLAEIDEDLAEAHATGDTTRAAQGEVEREVLVQELSRAVGLGGRNRRAGSASERARSAVTRAMRHALARIRKHHAPLGEHLDRTIRTGTYCVYLPDPRFPVDWKV
jgi:hypothetical protein